MYQASDGGATLVAAAIFNLDGEQWRTGDVDRVKTMARVHSSGGEDGDTA
jgi:hypothetical protein